jgi:hypothetical protein
VGVPVIKKSVIDVANAVIVKQSNKSTSIRGVASLAVESTLSRILLLVNVLTSLAAKVVI